MLARHRLVRTRTVLTSLALGLVACAVVIAAWPYYHLWSVSQGQLDVLDPVHKPLYAHILRWYALGAALGLVALALRWRRDRMDVLALMFLGLGAVVAYGAATQHWSYGRSWPMAILVAQIATAVAVAETKPGRIRWLWTVPVAVCTAIGVSTQFGALLYLMPASMQTSIGDALGVRARIENIPHLDALDKYFTPDEVVVAPNPLKPPKPADAFAQFQIAAHGSYGVSSPWYLPDLSQSTQLQRAAAVQTIFSGPTPKAERVALLTQYHVTWVLLAPGQQLASGFPAALTAQEAGYRLYRVTD